MKKLGKRAPKHDPRTLRFSKYALPKITVADEVSWVTEVDKWPMYMNDVINDCVAAAAGHMVQQWSSYAKKPSIPRERDILKMYEAVGDFRPGDPESDRGMVMLDALKYWRRVGVGGHKIQAFVALDPKNFDQIKSAIWLFGNAYLGLDLPASADGKNSWTVADGGVYTPTGAPGSWGGHCVPVMAASPVTLTAITWGQRLKLSHNFLVDYCDEAYAVLSSDWIEKNGMSPGNFNLEALVKDLAAL